MAITNSGAAKLVQSMNNISGDGMEVTNELAEGETGGAAVLYIGIAIAGAILLAVIGFVKLGR